jgi:probable F420-dependent oxidoreductase
MKFGLSTLTRGLCTTRAAYQAVAQAAERAGFDFLSVSDHVVVPQNLKSAYPYAAGGAFGAAEHGHCFDQLTTLAFLAGCTERLRLLTSVLVVPHRPPILAAKQLATIDVLSQGRLIVGAGAGWMREEFALLGAPFEARGSATDEYLEAFRILWTHDRPAYQGTHLSFSDVLFYPKPLQQPHPPIWIGGESRAARQRAIKFADAWYPGNNNQRWPLDTAERLAAAIAGIQSECEMAGRHATGLGISLLVQDPFDWGAHKTQDGSARRLFTGSSLEMQADAAALSAIGVGHVAIRLGGQSVQDAVGRIERFGAEVIAKSATGEAPEA